MPFARPDTSFQIAVRHLFRHIDEPAALRRNPLVQSFFRGSGKLRDDYAAVASIRAHMLSAADACYSEDIAADRGPYARRCYQIIAGVCAGRVPADVAADLNVSLRQYYRDRSKISMRVAKLLVSSRCAPANRIEVRDSIKLLFQCATSLVEQGFSARSTALLSGALNQLNSNEATFAALIGIASAQIQFGNIVRATQSYDHAKALFQQHIYGRGNGALEDLLKLTAVNVGLASGRDADVDVMLDALTKRYEEPRTESADFALDVFLESCSLHLLNGRFLKARAALSKAFDLATRLDSQSPNVHTRVYLAVYAAGCSEYQHGHPDQTLVLYDKALQSSLSAGSARGTGYAMQGLMRAHLRLGNDEQAFYWFKQSLEVAHNMEGTKALISAANAGVSLLTTRFWVDVGRLLNEVRGLVAPGTLKCARIHAGLGVCLARSGNLPDALGYLREAQQLAEKLNNSRLAADILRERALVLYRLGRTSEAAQSIRNAVSIAETRANALSLYQTYRAASKILADRRMLRMARGLKHILAPTRL